MTKQNDFLEKETPREKCAVFGIYGKNLDAARLTYFGLYALQHRGQEASGIAASDGNALRVHKAQGLVAQVYAEHDLEKLTGHMAIGHNRYSTSGGSISDHNQPVAGRNDIVALAHNGNLPSTIKLQNFLRKKGFDTNSLNDSELMHLAIKYYLVKGLTLEGAIQKAYPLFTGAFCLMVMTKDKIAAVRDPFGIRPLSLGKLNHSGYVFSSETCAFDTVNAEQIRDVDPGEMVVIDETGLHSYKIAKPNQKLDIFEFVYFSRPDSVLLGKRVYEVRRNLGIQLAKEYPIDADVVIPVPDSAIPAAIGYSGASGIPFEHGLVKNRYIGRTFILPDQRLRDRGVQMKLNPIEEIIKGKRVIVIDDSIVRGTTAQKLVRMIREAGAKEVHLMSSCPPVQFPDFYGIDTPSQKALIAANMTIPQIRDFVGADTVSFLSYKGMIKATGLPENVFCTSCFTGKYPIDIGALAKEINFSFSFQPALIR
ncbi:MAG: amidophosphoribosyltransferase [Candidatus Levybacteria bacterium]|nr:amidophosphoribosyltransferase [Candidatus Levybacteria bacterium]